MAEAKTHRIIPDHTLLAIRHMLFSSERVDSRGGVEGRRSPGSEVECWFGTGAAEMLADPDLLLMLAQQLTPNDVAIFGHDAHQSIDILRMLTDQFG